MINEERTLAEFGYVSGNLTRGSSKKIWIVCETCGKERRITSKRYNLDSKYKHKCCALCVKKYINRTQRGPFTVEYFKRVEESLNDGEVDEIRTLTEFGYYSIDLSSQSKRYIYIICDVCKEARKVVMGNYTNASLICRPCSMRIRFGIKRGPFIIEYFNNVQASIDIGEIDEIKTFECFGYYSVDLSLYSNRQIYVICGQCGIERPMKHSTYIRSGGICYKCVAQLFSNRKRSSIARQCISYSEWKGFTKKHLYCTKFNEKIKEYIREKYGRRCFLCNHPEEENITSKGKMQKLSVHHVDMNKNQGCDEHEWKLVPLCIKCHNLKTAREMQPYIEYILKLENIKFSIHSTKREQTKRRYRY